MVLYCRAHRREETTRRDLAGVRCLRRSCGTDFQLPTGHSAEEDANGGSAYERRTGSVFDDHDYATEDLQVRKGGVRRRLIEGSGD